MANQRAASSDHHLPEALDRHRPWLRVVIAARLEEKSAIDDVLQETMLAAVKNRQQLADSEKLAPWLYKIAIRQAVLYRRVRGRQRKLVNGYANAYTDALQLGHDSNPAAQPAQWLLRQETINEVREAVRILPRRDREILMLKYERDWTYQQMAAHLGLGLSAVKFRLLRARKRLRALLSRGTEDANIPPS